MKRSNNLILGAVMAALLVAGSSVVAQDQVTITVITEFDYPLSNVSTVPFGINSAGDIAGYIITSGNVQRGFVRFSDGTFSEPIVHPEDTGNLTWGSGINSAQTVSGTFINAARNANLGYLLSAGKFTTVDIDPPFSTVVYKINDRGDFVGAYGNPRRGFVNIGGSLSTMVPKGAAHTFAIGINNFAQVVGVYEDIVGTHGFFVDSDGTLIAPIDFPGASSTTLNGISDAGWIVGRYQDSGGRTHGLFLILPNTFVSFDFPDAISTSLNGINGEGFISARYTDSAGVMHGFLAQAQVAKAP